MKLFFTIFIFLLSLSYTYSQGAANNWYFGDNAGITFSTNPPSALNNGKLNTIEGCASISDTGGNLLFYTDGSLVYNRNHEVMINGTGLLGDKSSSQSAIIIPKPLDTNIYYVFTVDNAIDGGNDGVNYSVVDFTNNPDGEITDKNIKLLSNSAEKLSAVVRGCDTDTIWMVTLSTESGGEGNLDTFYAFSISTTGVNTNPVKSRVSMTVDDVRGNLKFSPDGTKLACANMQSGLYLLDFNSATGRARNPLSIPLNSPDFAPYGVEFSPDNRYLYVSSSNDLPINGSAIDHSSSLFQYDLQNTDIISSQVIIEDQNTLYRGSLQLGPDGRIYRAMSGNYDRGLPYLSVIDQPNSAGLACNYILNAINLGSGNSLQGLPPFNQSLFNTVDIIQNNVSSSILNLCADESYVLSYDNVPGAIYTWYKDGAVVTGETTNQITISRPANSTLPYNEQYELTIDFNDGTCPLRGLAEVFYYDYPSQPLNPVTLINCEDSESSDGLSAFNLNEATPLITGNDPTLSAIFYETQQDAQNGVNALDPDVYYNTSPNQTLYAYIANPADCNVIVPFQLGVSNNQSRTVILNQCDIEEDGYAGFNLRDADSELIGNQLNNPEVFYYLTEEAALLKTSDELLPDLYLNETPYLQTIYARLENNASCYAIHKVELTVNELPNFDLMEEAYYCATTFPEKTVIQPDYQLDSRDNYAYQWLPEGQTTEYLETNLIGQHTLTVTNLDTGCERSRTVNIIERELATIVSIETTDLSDNNTAIITVSGNGNYEFALDETGPYQDENIFNNLVPGFYTLFVRSKDGCGIVSEDFSILGYLKYFTPNGDGYHDYWQVRGVNDEIQPNTVIYIYDRYGKLLKQLSARSQGWDGNFNGRPLPSDDYWFHIIFEDGREVKSHFTLKR